MVNSPDANLMKEKKNVSKQIVWRYSSKNNTSFYSTIGSGAQRLPNGNTLVCSMNDGHFFEVAPADTSIVWEYFNPMTRNGIKTIKVDNYPTYNGVFRAYRYAGDHPALAGHDLTPGATMTGNTPDYLTPDDLLSTMDSEIQPGLGQNSLKQNYPNPFSTGTMIEFNLAEPALVSLVIYDFSGKQVKSLVHQNCSVGKFSRNWDGKNDQGTQVAAGMYIYVLKADNQQLAKKMIYYN